MSHPVQLAVEPPPQIPRAQVLIRLALVLAIMVIGYSSIFWGLYLAMPAFVALVVTRQDGAGYLAGEGSRLVRVLRWLAAAHAYLWFLSNELPTAERCHVDLQIETGAPPTVGSSLARIVTSLPALVLLTVLHVAAAVVWVVSVVTLLVSERMPGVCAEFLVLTLRLHFRFLAYHLSLTERYPSFEASTIQVRAES